MIKVILADDQRMFLDGMRNALEKDPEIKIIGEATTGEDVLQLLKQKEVDLVVLDIDMPNGMDGIEATKIIRMRYPKTQVLILSMFDNKEFIIQLMRYGAAGYILKNKTSKELLMAIHNVAAGRTHYGLEVMGRVTDISETYELEEVQLSKREVEILEKVAEGNSSDEIASLLNISVTTVSKHRQNILNKLGLKNAVQLTRFAIRNGYVKV